MCTDLIQNRNEPISRQLVDICTGKNNIIIESWSLFFTLKCAYKLWLFLHVCWTFVNRLQSTHLWIIITCLFVVDRQTNSLVEIIGFNLNQFHPFYRFILNINQFGNARGDAIATKKIQRFWESVTILMELFDEMFTITIYNFNRKI